MTDSRITVDVSAEALVQRAREQQAQSRQMVIQQEEEKREKARQQAAAQKAGRGSVPGQGKLQGRSRPPQTGSKRREVAAGYVPQQLKVASGFVLPDYENGDIRILSKDGRASVALGLPDTVGTGTAPGQPPPRGPQSGSNTLTSPFLVAFALPVNGNALLMVTQYQVVTRSIAWEWTGPFPGPILGQEYWELVENVSFSSAGPVAQSYVVSRSAVRRIATPSHVAAWMQGFLDKQSPPYEDDFPVFPYEDYQVLSQGLSLALYETEDGTYNFNVASMLNGKICVCATPSALFSIANSNADNWSRLWLDFRRSEADPIISQAYKIKDLDPVLHNPTALNLGSPVRGLTVQTGTYDETDFVEPVVTWDWGNPALCRRLLLQLGFSSSDLVP